MPWVKMPIQDQWQNALDVNASGFVFKTYEYGTTTPTPMAIDSVGATTVATVTLNADGIPEVSGNEVTLYIDQDFRFAIYENASDAAANTNAFYGPVDVDNVLSGDINQFTSYTDMINNLSPSAYADGDVVFLTDSGISGSGNIRKVVGHGYTSTAGVIVRIDNDTYWEREFSGLINVRWFGALGDGSTDDTSAFREAVKFADGQVVFVPAGNFRITGAVNVIDGANTTTIELRFSGVGGSYQHVRVVDDSSSAYDLNATNLASAIDGQSAIFCDGCNFIGESDTASAYNASTTTRLVEKLIIYGDNGAEMGIHVAPKATTIRDCLFAHFEYFGLITRGGITSEFDNLSFDTNGFGLSESGSTTGTTTYGGGCNIKINSNRSPQAYHTIDGNVRPTTLMYSNIWVNTTTQAVNNLSGLRVIQAHGLIGCSFDRVGGYEGSYFAVCEDTTFNAYYSELYSVNGVNSGDAQPRSVYQTQGNLVFLNDSMRNLGGNPGYQDIEDVLGATGRRSIRLKNNATKLVNLDIVDDLTVNTDTLYVDSGNSRVGVGNLTPAYELEVLGASTPIVNVQSTDNSGAFFRASNGSKAYSMGVDTTSTNDFFIRDATASLTRILVDTGGDVSSGEDNLRNCGTASLRWKEIFAGTGTINTSDAREKTEVVSLTKNELAAAKELSKEIGGFKWLTSIDSKGAEARFHIGMTVQRAIEIMESHGLDPMGYGFICYDQWDDKYEPVWETIPLLNKDGSSVFDENGNQKMVERQTGERKLLIAGGDRYGFRIDQLVLFIIAGIEARLADMGI